MRAVTCQDGKFEVVDLPSPEPGKGQLLIDVLRCGICGSDLHARYNCDELADVTAETGYDGIMRSDQAVVMGHEFCGEIVDYGSSCRKWGRPGTRVVAMPMLRRGKDVQATGLSASAPGGYAEQMLVEESLAFAVPNGLPTEFATLTEPMAVGLHAVRRSEIGKGTVAIVIGCGPVGLAVICMLRSKGVETAGAYAGTPQGDPAIDSPYQATPGKGHVEKAQDMLNLALDAMGKLRRIPVVPWERVYRAAETVGVTNPKHPVIFECVGVPGIIDDIVSAAPLYSRVVVVGVCMAPDNFRPVRAINKEIDLRFVLGYTPIEFRDSLHLLADGKVNAAPVVTGVVGLAGIDNAFTVLGDPEAHAKILIDPRSPNTVPG